MGKLKFVLNLSIDKIGISARQLAKEAGVRHSTVYDILNNKSDRPPRSTLEKILDALNKLAKEKEIDYEFDINDIYKYIK
jgi:predicted transcriptional regulator